VVLDEWILLSYRRLCKLLGVRRSMLEHEARKHPSLSLTHTHIHALHTNHNPFTQRTHKITGLGSTIIHSATDGEDADPDILAFILENSKFCRSIINKRRVSKTIGWRTVFTICRLLTKYRYICTLSSSLFFDLPSSRNYSPNQCQ